MKKIKIAYVTICVAFALSNTLYAQEKKMREWDYNWDYGYYPITSEGVKDWTVDFVSFRGVNGVYVTDSYEFSKIVMESDSIEIDGQYYRPLYHYDYNDWNEAWSGTDFKYRKLIGGLREEGKKVYFKKIEPVGCDSAYYSPLLAHLPQDGLLYDFDLSVGDTLPFTHRHKFVVSEIDTVLLQYNMPNYVPRYSCRPIKKFTLEAVNEHNWPDSLIYHDWKDNGLFLMEGIGSNRGLLYDLDYEYESVYENMTCRYDGVDYQADTVFSGFLQCCNENGEGLIMSDSRDANGYWRIGCSLPDPYLEPYLLVGLKEIADFEGEIKVFPNPATTYVDLKIESEKRYDYVFTLYNIYGDNVLQSKIESSSIRIDLKDIAPGTYLYTIGTKSKIFKYEKIVINR